LAINYNGPAIWGGCVTRRRHRTESWYFSRETVTVQGGYGTCFCRHGIKFYCVLARSRYNFDRSREFIPGYKIGGVHWRSVAVQTFSKPENSHGAEFKLRTDVRVRVLIPLKSCLGSRNKSKNRDKQLTHIVRVRCRVFYNCQVISRLLFEIYVLKYTLCKGLLDN
jgi:hypothetical protein